MAKRLPGKVHRYKITGFWGQVPDQIKELCQHPDGYCVDYWRSRETSWELMGLAGQITGGWSGIYAGVSPAAIALTDGQVSP